MPRILAPLAIFVALGGVVNAGIQITKPESGFTAKAGSSLEVEWKEGGTGPALADLDSFTIDLCSGSNDAPVCGLASIAANQQFSTAITHAEGRVLTSVGEDKPANAYFVRMVAKAKTGGTLTTYSSRFSYSGMTGTFAPEVKTALDKLKSTDTSGPATKDETAKKPGDAAASGDFGVGYTMQTGPTRYAPMQPVPGTKITKSKATPQFPTSAFTIAKSHLPIPSIVTTVTQSQTHKVTSVANKEPAATHPDDMAKFLARWKD